MHRVLREALQQAVGWQLLARNPADAVKPPKVERAPMRTYDLAQTAELIAAMRGTRFFVPVLLAVLCGLRRGEVAALRWVKSISPRDNYRLPKAPSRPERVCVIRSPSPVGLALLRCRRL